MHKLYEGMRPNDLEDLVLPLLSIDEYESKIDDDAVVVGFYVSDQDAAEDLNRFIQKSAINILDSEISPAPDQHGYYLVFVEMLNDRRLVSNIADLLSEVSPLCGTDKWQMRLRMINKVLPFSPKILSKRFAEMRADLLSNDKDDQIIEFFKNSDLENVLIEDHRIYLYKQNMQFNAEIIAMDKPNRLMEAHALGEQAFDINVQSAAETLKVENMLGNGWVCNRMGEHIILQNQLSSAVLLLKSHQFQ